ncbi:MAG: DUF4442 domain-containing protein [Fluviicola sp.]|nr:DUF4442 domain-containing protein [Fluviicola sp.]
MEKTKEITLKQMQRKLWLLSVFKIPIIGFVKPKLLLLNEKESRVKIKLRRRTKNHLNSMYFGALAVGADVAAGLHVFYFSETMGHKVSFAFKGIKGEFIKRAESDVIFKIDQGELIREAILNSYATKERVNQSIDVVAIDANNELVANFVMIVSVKVK